MSLAEVNSYLFRKLNAQCPGQDLRGITAKMSEAERFTYLRMATEIGTKDPVRFLRIIQQRPHVWERHCDLSWQARSVKHYEGVIAKSKAA